MLGVFLGTTGSASLQAVLVSPIVRRRRRNDTVEAGVAISLPTHHILNTNREVRIVKAALGR